MIEDKKVGTFGDFATFSFFPGKNLGAYGDAGCVITNNKELATKARMFANHGGLEKHSHEIEGINSRLDGIQASILITKLHYIDDWTNLRIELANDYCNSISNEKIFLPKTKENFRHVFHLYVLRTSNRDNLKHKLESKGVSTGIHYPEALPFLGAYKYLGHKLTDFPVSNRITKEILSIPIYPELNREELDYISSILNES
jgi:dTDP-4-amino-4,6-dideoxygalactose transaminase